MTYCYADNDPQSVCDADDEILSNMYDIYSYATNNSLEYRLFNSDSTRFTIDLDMLNTASLMFFGNPFVLFNYSYYHSKNSVYLTDADIHITSKSNVSHLHFEYLKIVDCDIQVLNISVRISVAYHLVTTMIDLLCFEKVETASLTLSKSKKPLPMNGSGNITFFQFHGSASIDSSISIYSEKCQLTAYPTIIKLLYLNSSFKFDIVLPCPQNIQFVLDSPETFVNVMWYIEFSSLLNVLLDVRNGSTLYFTNTINMYRNYFSFIDVYNGSIIFSKEVSLVPFQIRTLPETDLKLYMASTVEVNSFKFKFGKISIIAPSKFLLQVQEIIFLDKPNLISLHPLHINALSLTFNKDMNMDFPNITFSVDLDISLKDTVIHSNSTLFKNSIAYKFSPTLTQHTGFYTRTTNLDTVNVDLYYPELDIPSEDIIQKNKFKRFWFLCAQDISCDTLKYTLSIHTSKKFNYNKICEVVSPELTCAGIYYTSSPREIDIDICYNPNADDQCNNHYFVFDNENITQWINLVTRETQTIKFNFVRSTTVPLYFGRLKSSVDVSIVSLTNETINVSIEPCEYIKTLTISGINLDVVVNNKNEIFPIKQIVLLNHSSISSNVYTSYNLSNVKLTIDFSELDESILDYFGNVDCLINANYVLIKVTNTTVIFNTHHVPISKIPKLNFISSCVLVGVHIKENVTSLMSNIRLTSSINPKLRTGFKVDSSFDNYTMNRFFELWNFSKVVLSSNSTYVPIHFADVLSLEISSKLSKMRFPDQSIASPFLSDVQINTRTVITLGTLFVRQSVTLSFSVQSFESRPIITSIILSENVSVVLSSVAISGYVLIPPNAQLLITDCDVGQAVIRFEGVAGKRCGYLIQQIANYHESVPSVVEIDFAGDVSELKDAYPLVHSISVGTTERWSKKVVFLNKEFYVKNTKYYAETFQVNSVMQIRFLKDKPQPFPMVHIVVISILSVSLFLMSLIILSLAACRCSTSKKQENAKSSSTFSTLSD